MQHKAALASRNASNAPRTGLGQPITSTVRGLIALEHRRPAGVVEAMPDRRTALQYLPILAAPFLGLGSASAATAVPAMAVDAPPKSGIANFEPMAALKGKDYGKSRMTYKDYVTTPSGLEYQDLVPGTGETPQPGDTVVIDWAGYTIGYYGRPFEARNKSKGGSFTGDNKEFYRFVLGNQTVIPAFEEAVATLKVGGTRRIIVPVELGYPNNNYKAKGPQPSNFSGERALDFVLRNQGLIDKTLLFDIELIRVESWRSPKK